MSKHTLREIGVTLRRTPPLLLLQKVLRRVPFRPVDVGKLCFLRLDQVPHVPAALLRGTATVRPATRKDFNALVHLQNKPDVFLSRFSAGDLCVVAEADGRIVGYEWFCEKPVHREAEWGVPIEIPGG